MMALSREIELTLNAVREIKAEKGPSTQQQDAIAKLEARKARVFLAMNRTIEAGTRVTDSQIRQLTEINYKLTSLGASR